MNRPATDYRALLKDALVKIKTMQAELGAHAQKKTEPIAVVGLACRFPGGARDPESFWYLLRNGIDAMRGIPPERWDVDRYYDPQPGQPGKIYARQGGFLSDVEQFDPGFFNISPREAVTMDPQQRLLLEVAWESLEQAAMPPARLRNTRTGVFLGMMPAEYTLLTHHPDRIDAYTGTGTDISMAAGRIAYILGLHGPTLTLDTACSSALVSVHLACQSLRSGECDLALAGGANLILAPEQMIVLSRLQALSPTSRCHTFDAQADGMARGEGCGMVALKPLSAALRDGDPIWALIRGSAVNHDGPSSGLTVPNELAQEALIRQALDNAQTSPEEISYIEAHGTGTKLGDPIEVGALGTIFAKGRQRPLWIGSVKTNFGHLEAAAGIASLIKVILSLQQGEIPPSLHFHTPNPLIDWAGLPIRVPTQATPWPPETRAAGVSSFGLSGTNAHLVVEKAPEEEGEKGRKDEEKRQTQLFVLSAKDAAALTAYAARYADFLDTHPQVSLADLCYTAQTGRSHFPYRLSVAAARAEALQAQLRAFGQEPSAASRPAADKAPGPVFLFTGQGAQYAGMGRELYGSEPIFRAIIDRCDAAFREAADRSLIELIYPTTPPTHNDLMESHPCGQAANFAIECALADLWRSWGVQPDFVLGHSLGDFAAAYTAGVIGLEDGLHLVTERGRLMETALGAMLSVLGSEAEVTPHISDLPDVTIGVINGPASVVLSGSHPGVALADERLQDAGFKTRKLDIPVAAHSPMLDPVLDDFAAAVGRVRLYAPTLPVVSSMTGTRVSDELTDPAYWRRQLRQTVRFADGVQTLAAAGCQLFVEIGPRSTLLGLAGQVLDKLTDGAPIARPPGHPVAPSLLPSLREGQPDRQQMLASLGELYVQGVEIDWAALHRGAPRRKISLPTYPFQRQPYWVDSPAAARRSDQGLRPLIDRRVIAPLHSAHLFETEFSLDRLPFLADHRVYGRIVSPGALQLALALSAAEVFTGSPACRMEDIVLPAALILPQASQGQPAPSRTLQLTLHSQERDFQLISFAPDSPEPPITHTSGRLADGAQAQPPGSDVTADDGWLERLQAACPDSYPLARLHSAAQTQQIELGSTFRWITHLWTGEEQVLARLAQPESVPALADTPLHPGLLDACFQVASLPDGSGQEDGSGAHLPFALQSLSVRQAARSQGWWCHARRTQDQKWRIRLLDESGQQVLEIDGYETRLAPPQALGGREVWRDWLYAVEWQPQPLADRTAYDPQPDRAGGWLVVTEDAQSGAALTDRLAAGGQDASLLLLDEDLPHSNNGDLSASPPGYRIRPDAAEAYQSVLDRLPHLGHVVLLAAPPERSSRPDADWQKSSQALCSQALHLVQALLGADSAPPQLWLVTRGAQAVHIQEGNRGLAHALWWGLGRALALEHPELAPIAIDIGPEDEMDALCGELLAGSTPDQPQETQLALRGPRRYAARLVRHNDAAAPLPDAPFHLDISQRGALENLHLRSGVRSALAPDEIEIRVHATGLNFVDLLDAMDMLPFARENGSQGAEFGSECTGEVIAVGAAVENFAVGDRVAALAFGGFASHYCAPAALAVALPAHLSFVEGATIPANFLTAYWALHEAAHIQAGDKVLIHAGAGGTGMAAIQLAQQAGAEVFATASPAKWASLRALGVTHLYHSRNLDFAEQILADTGGQGVDIVLNSLTGAGFVETSLTALASQGRFVEIAKRDIWGAAQVGDLRPDVRFHLVDLRHSALHTPEQMQPIFRRLIQQFDGSAQGLRPLPVQRFPITQVAAAFRFMQRAEHIGKIVVTQPVETPLAVRETATYLIVGGAGGLGWLTAQWLVAKGARHLLLLGRSAPRPEIQAQIDQLRQTGVDVTFARGDVAERERLAQVLSGIDPRYPLAGVIHAAGVLDDGIVLEQTPERFARVLGPKAWGGWNLHLLTREMSLDFFVLYASVAGLLGSAGQTNHAAANAFLDGLAQQRQAQGLPGLAIDWGAWSGVGAAAQRQEALRLQAGMGAIAPEQGLEILDYLFAHHRAADAAQGVAQVGVLPIRWADFQPAQVSPFLAAFQSQEKPAQDHLVEDSLLEELGRSGPDKRAALLEAHLQSQVARILGHSTPAAIGRERAFVELGMDSLMAVELRNRLQQSLACRLPATLAFEHPSIRALADYLAYDGLGLAARSAPEEASVPADDELTELSDDEIEALLAQELMAIEEGR